MFEKLANIFRIPDLRKRILFTLGLLAVYRLGGHIPTPGVNADKLQQFFEQNRGSFLGFVDLFSGGQLRRLTIFALGILPYITASIILQLLTVVYEPLTKLQKEGELGRKKITQWTRYLTFGLSSVQSFGIAIGLEKAGDFVVNPGWGFRLMTMLTLTTGIAFIVYVERSERLIPVQYAKRVVGRKVMGGQSTHLPLRVNAGGVMPVIFASSILTLPQTIGYGLRDNRYFGPMMHALGWGEPLYTLLYAVGIIFFAYFYVSIVFNPNEVADNMRKYGGFIPGIRPGRRTADHINEILTRITLVGALYLIIISFIPAWMITGIHLNHLYGSIGAFFEHLPTWVTNGLGVNFYFGGTSLLIVVGVAMDTVTQIEAQLIMRHYDGFTPRSGRIRGRRSWS